MTERRICKLFEEETSNSGAVIKHAVESGFQRTKSDDEDQTDDWRSSVVIVNRLL